VYELQSNHTFYDNRYRTSINCLGFITCTIHSAGIELLLGSACLRHGNDPHLKESCSVYGGQQNTAAAGSNFSFEDYPATFDTKGEFKTYSNHGISFQYYSHDYLTVQVNNGNLNGLNNTLLVDILSINPNNPIPMVDLNITVFELDNPHAEVLFSQTYGRELDPGGDDVVIGDGIHAYRTTKYSDIIVDPTFSQSSVSYTYSFTNKNKGYVIDYTASRGVGISNEDAEEMLSSLKIQ
jgi:hypothetical protein